ncbi:MAG TPA: hypothetical protein VF451_00320 [Acidobacteriota bacterium]
MRTINRRKLQALSPSLAVLISLAAFSLPSSAAPPPAGWHRFFVAAAAGLFSPGQDAFRKAYAPPAWPVELQLGLELERKLDLFAAARYLRASGNTVPLPPLFPEETYALRLEVLCLRLGVNYRLGRGRIAPFVGAGAQYVFFKETWRDLSVEAHGRTVGFFAAAGGLCRLGRSLHFLAQLDYSSIPAGAAGGLAESADLGGLSLLLGIRCGIF